MKLFAFLFLFPVLAIAQTVEPIPPSGLEKFVDYVNLNFTKHRSASEKNLKGDIVLELRVTEKGKVDSFHVVKDLGKHGAQDLIQVIRKAGDWTPATKEGVAVAQWVKFPYQVADAIILPANTGQAVLATPQNGWDQFNTKFSKEFRYPESARNARFKGSIRIQFVVKEDGSLTSLSLVDNPGFNIEENAIRAMRRSGKWNPVTINGEYQKVYSYFDFDIDVREYKIGVR